MGKGNVVTPNVTQDDQDYRDGKISRMCSCQLDLLHGAYQAHLKDGTHSKRLEKKGEAMPA